MTILTKTLAGSIAIMSLFLAANSSGVEVTAWVIAAAGWIPHLFKT